MMQKKSLKLQNSKKHIHTLKSEISVFSSWDDPFTDTALEFKRCTLGYNEFDFFLENKEYRPCDGCKIEI